MAREPCDLAILRKFSRYAILQPAKMIMRSGSKFRAELPHHLRSFTTPDSQSARWFVTLFYGADSCRA
jgi:hypothetical protein